MTTNDLDAIRKLADAATDAPWTTGADKQWADALTPWALIPNADYPLTEMQPGPQGVADAAFIAAARTHVPNLCDEVEQLRAELAKAAETLIPLHALLAQSRTNAATYATEVGQLTAENAQVRQDRDTKADIAKNRAVIITNLGAALNAHAAVVEAARTWRFSGNTAGDHREAIAALNAAVDALPKAEATPPDYLIWSHHHQSWWGPSRSGYRADPADAGRYTLAAAKAEMTRGCHCCQVPEVPVFAAKVVGKGTEAVRDAISQATDWTVMAGQANKAYEPPVCRACDKPGYHPETCPTVPAEGHDAGSDPDCDDCAAEKAEATR